ncbi:3-hydroxyacyl-CoA dehydrogenase [Nocardia sp. NPDC051756]|uniref:3-hydroxyacyl-CoA dehydrogenase n=1 Tax=Nocardia sp. NPDC051756 TaxID=3154751 RepID=UPI003420FD6D
MTINIRKVTVLGTGVLGSQIAYQTAFSGFDVTAYDITESALAAARDRFTGLATIYRDEAPGAHDGKAEKTAAAITLTTHLGAAVRDADLVIEAVPEILTIKQHTYELLSAIAPERTIFATNSSTLLPSAIAGFTGRPEKFLALHFANEIWKRNIAEVMGTTDTDPAVFRAVVDFAATIGMVPVEIHKEKAGYILNSLLGPFLMGAIELVGDGYADAATVDATWKIVTDMPAGPCQMLDIVGLNTPYNILANGTDHQRNLAKWLKDNYIDQGKHGVATGEGFYRYPASAE